MNARTVLRWQRQHASGKGKVKVPSNVRVTTSLLDAILSQSLPRKTPPL